MTSHEFDRVFVEMIEPFEKADALADVMSSLYADVIGRIIVVDPYFGSCNVFLPPNLVANLAAIAGEAGYLHSCGHSVFVRNVTKADPNLLRNKLSQHLKDVPVPHGKFLRFLVYADEDFTNYDRADASLLRAGLDDAKVHIEKAAFRTERLVDVVEKLKESMSDILVFGGGKDYRLDREEHSARGDVDLSRTIWLVQDRSVGEPCEQPGPSRYYACYDQLFRARNAVHQFDENKPAWQDHTTLPPSLAGALLNIVRRPARAEKPLSVADPFVGTGTSLLETLRFRNMLFHGSDIDPVSELLVEDNLAFFRSSPEAIVSIANHLSRAKAQLELALRNDTTDRVEDTDIFKIAIALFDTEALADEACSIDSLPPATASRLPQSLPDRLLAYVALRASKRGSARFVRKTPSTNIHWGEACLSELQVLLAEVGSLSQLHELKLLDEKETDALLHGYGYVNGCPHTVVLLHDEYSIGAMPREQRVSCDSQNGAFQNRYTLAGGKDSADEATWTDNAFDIIVGDPPYGFNSPAEALKLAELYRAFSRHALRALKDGGDLVLCLPELSHSGRYSPPFTHRGLVIQHLHAAAGELERQLIFPEEKVLGADALCRGHHYWESERALRRSILHVQVRRAATTAV